MNKKILRREFLKKSSKAAAAFSILPFAAGSNVNNKKAAQKIKENASITVKECLENIIYTEKEIDDWFAGKAFPFAKYSGEFGWLLPNNYFRDGIDNSVSVYNFAGEDGERIMINYKDKPCRINTYGDSFTQCHQVSDGETWQEVLAANFQEPVRNFGIGGWSLYQAYLRMLKEEKRTPSECIIFNIYDDDHKRNLDSWRNIRVKKHERFIEPTLPFVKVNLKEKSFVEFKNPCPTKEIFYNLADSDWVYETFKNDFVLQIMLAHKNANTKNPYQSYSDIMNLATTHGINTKIEDSETLIETANDLHNRSAIFASEGIVEKVEKFAKENNKKVLYVLSFPAGSIVRYVEEGKRWDQPFVDFMKSKGLPFVDLMDIHVKEYSQFKFSIKDYLKKYFIGHYNPMGNLFCAFALKNKLIEMLEPKPISYRENKDIMK